jgi:curved DNA-binding protein CbpA
MLAFIIALLIVVIIGSIVYGIYKIIAGISKFGFVQSMQKSKGKRCRKSSTDHSKRTYNKQSTTKNRNNEYYRRQENKNPLDEHYWNRHWYEDDEDVFDDIYDDIYDDWTDDIFDDIFENDDGPSQIDKDKLVRARLERFHLSEDEAELIFGKKWRNKLSQGNFDLFYQIAKMRLDLLGLNKSFGKKVSHIIDKVIQMIDTVYNENPEYAKSFEKFAEESNPGAIGTVKKAWEFFKKHKKAGFEYSENILDTSEAYKIFDLAITATVEQKKKKYRELVLKWHPDRYKGDKTVAEKMMMKINQAYETIMAAA